MTQELSAKRTIKARPTVYRGIQMRSRLEATVAAELDRLRFEWIYEPRAYGAPGRRQYLPDFELHYKGIAATAYLEVRPTADLAYEAMEQMTVIWQSEPDAYLLVDVPGIAEWQATPKDRTFRLDWLGA